MSTLIGLNDPRRAAATAVLDAMHAYFKLDPCGGAVRWIEDTDGRVVIFTRGEYRDKLMDAVGEGHVETREFEQPAEEEE